MKRRIEEVKKIVIKVGSSSLCDKDGKINKEKILMLTWQIAKLKREGYIVVLVSSGAIAAGMGALGLDSKPKTLPEKQALAAIGQARLMEIYEEIFQVFNMKCSQILLNHDDFDDRHRLMNLNHTINALLNYGVVPIINENDALAVDEIKVGDNDTLASLIVPLVEAQLLILVSDIDGLYTGNPHTPDDISIIGYDGLKIGSFYTPKLSTVSQSVELLARRSFSVLMDCAERSGHARHMTVPFTLSNRESVRKLENS